MPKTFFTSDTHFGHKNIIKLCDRPFETLKEMDDTLIANWNSVVGEEDTVYHLGDFALAGRTAAKKYFSRLNGRIKVLSYPWHHDRGWIKEPMPSYFWAAKHPVELLPPMDVLRASDDRVDTAGQHIVLSHFPLAAWDRKHYGALHLHGHCHGDRPPHGKMWDVGVDNNDYFPLTAAEALAKIPKVFLSKEFRRRHQ